jgi:hypothetical protein
MTSNVDQPGYKCKPNHDGSIREYWAARPDLVKRGYAPKAVRLHYDNTPVGRQQLAARCRTLQAEMLAWAANEGRIPARGYDGTVGSLCRLYQVDEVSPFRKRLKWNSAVNVAKSLKVIESSVAARVVGRLVGPDFYRWHERWGAPKEKEAPPGHGAPNMQWTWFGG